MLLRNAAVRCETIYIFCKCAILVHLFLFLFAFCLENVTFFPSFLHSNRSSMTSRALLVDPLPKCCSSTIFEFASRWKFIHPEEGRDAFRNHRRFSLLSVSPNNKSIPLSGRKQIKKKRERKRKIEAVERKKGKKGIKTRRYLDKRKHSCAAIAEESDLGNEKKKIEREREGGRKNEREFTKSRKIEAGTPNRGSKSYSRGRH